VYGTGLPIGRQHRACRDARSGAIRQALSDTLAPDFTPEVSSVRPIRAVIAIYSGSYRWP